MDLLGQSKTVTDQLLEQAIAANCSGYSAIKYAQECGKRLVWGNIDGTGSGPTPEQAVAILGTDAAKWFQVSALSAQMGAILDGVAPEIMPANWDYTVNPDGTVTLIRPE